MFVRPAAVGVCGRYDKCSQRLDWSWQRLVHMTNVDISNRPEYQTMRSLFATIALAIFAFTGPVAAGGQPVVVELFTSQGCSSCPPADEIITRLSERDDVLALALHVDYWDYLGWKDNFANPVFSARQRAYAKAAQKRTVYTPQVVVQGISHAIGNHENDVRGLIAFHARRSELATLDAARVGDALRIDVAAKTADIGKVVIQVVRFLPRKIVRIKAGENAGRTITYTNIVTSWVPVAQWNGRGRLSIRVPMQEGPQPIAVLVQSANFGPIIAAEVIE